MALLDEAFLLTRRENTKKNNFVKKHFNFHLLILFFSLLRMNSAFHGRKQH